MPHQKRALVTGGAGLIGSHLVDLLLREGWTVRILDNLEPQTHKNGKPEWVNPKAEFRQGFVQDYDTMHAALDDIDVVFHEAAYGGYMPEMAKYVLVNSFGTAQMLEIIRDKKLPIQKVVVASSQAVYSEGAALCPEHGHVVPLLRPVEQLRSGDFAVHCPVLVSGRPCGQPTTSIPTPESTPGGGETVYALTKVDQERLVLLWGKQTGIPTVALRYSCTYGPRQSLFNPYTGVIAIFCTRLLNGQQPVMYEDGSQTRDLCFVEDIARANLLVATTRQTRRPPRQRRQRPRHQRPRPRRHHRRASSASTSRPSPAASSAPAKSAPSSPTSAASAPSATSPPSPSSRESAATSTGSAPRARSTTTSPKPKPASAPTASSKASRPDHPQHDATTRAPPLLSSFDTGAPLLSCLRQRRRIRFSSQPNPVQPNRIRNREATTRPNVY